MSIFSRIHHRALPPKIRAHKTLLLIIVSYIFSFSHAFAGTTPLAYTVSRTGSAGKVCQITFDNMVPATIEANETSVIARENISITCAQVNGKPALGYVNPDNTRFALEMIEENNLSGIDYTAQLIGSSTLNMSSGAIEVPIGIDTLTKNQSPSNLSYTGTLKLEFRVNNRKQGGDISVKLRLKNPATVGFPSVAVLADFFVNITVKNNSCILVVPPNISMGNDIEMRGASKTVAVPVGFQCQSDGAIRPTLTIENPPGVDGNEIYPSGKPGIHLSFYDDKNYTLQIINNKIVFDIPGLKNNSTTHTYSLTARLRTTDSNTSAGTFSIPLTFSVTYP